ncbi:MAG: SLC13 family permease [Candidatus Limnocylindria bacterium]
MEWQGWVTLAVVIALVVVIARETIRPAVAILGATILLLLVGVIDPAQAFSGFSNEAPIIVASLLVLARAVDQSGLMGPLVAGLFGRATGPRGLLARLTFPLAGLSAFLNNTTLVAMTVPAVLDLCQRRGISPSRFLIPISYAAVLGGVVTAIGTSTNLTISGLLRDAGMRPLSLFELAPVGIPIAVAGCAAIVLLAGRMLPERGTVRGALTDGARSFTVSMEVTPGGQVDGRSVGDAGLRHLHGVFLVEVARGGARIAPVAPDQVLAGGDVITFVGRVDDIVDLQRMPGIASTETRQVAQLANGAHGFFEAVIGDHDLAGRTLREIGFRGTYGGAVLAVHRAGHRLDAKLGDVRLRMGDTLLVLADLGFRDRWRDTRDFLLIAPVQGIPPTQGRRALPMALIGLGFLLAAGTGLVPILQAALAAALLTVALRVLTLRQAREAVDLDIVLLIAAAFGLGAAVQTSGLGAALAEVLLTGLQPLGLLGALAGVLLATMALTELISNNAAAVLLFPVALATAAALGSDPRPFVMAVTYGASLSFLTPIGYQTNLMVYGLGGYRFTDFTRLGLPLNLLTIAIGLVLIPVVFPF